MMKTISKFILYILGWKIIGADNLSKKSVVAVAPHTSYTDGVIGYFAMKSLGVKFSVVSAEWLFFFPLNLIMKYVLHAKPCGPKSGNSITNSVKILNSSDEMHLVICPEGRLRAVEKWNKGFYIIAKRAQVPITPVIFNYRTKRIFITPEISTEYGDYNNVLYYIKRDCVDYACARYPEKFKEPKYE